MIGKDLLLRGRLDAQRLDLVGLLDCSLAHAVDLFGDLVDVETPRLPSKSAGGGISPVARIVAPRASNWRTMG
jgi:hypothetical protein